MLFQKNQRLHRRALMNLLKMIESRFFFHLIGERKRHTVLFCGKRSILPFSFLSFILHNKNILVSLYFAKEKEKNLL